MAAKGTGPSRDFGEQIVRIVLKSRGISNPKGVVSQALGDLFVEEAHTVSASCANLDELAAEVEELKRNLLSRPGDHHPYMETSRRIQEVRDTFRERHGFGTEDLCVEPFARQIEQEMIQAAQDVQDEINMNKCGNPSCSVREKDVLRKCRGCFKMAYCGDLCQRAHWSQHKVRCLHLHKKK